MSLFAVAILMVLPFVALAGMIAVGAFLVVQVTYEVIDRRATAAAVRLHTETRAGEPEPARQGTPAPATQTETARIV